MKFLLCFVVLCPIISSAQILTDEEFNKIYQENIQKEFINDVYIPIDVADAMKQLDLLSDDKGKSKLLEADENLAADRLVYGLGKWMIVYWNFYEGSRLSHHLKEYGLSHPEDMAKFLITTYHRYLRNAPLELKERGAIFFEKRKREQEVRNSQKKVISG